MPGLEAVDDGSLAATFKLRISDPERCYCRPSSTNRLKCVEFQIFKFSNCSGEIEATSKSCDIIQYFIPYNYCDRSFRGFYSLL